MEAYLTPNEYNTANYYWSMISGLSTSIKQNLAERINLSIHKDQSQALSKKEVIMKKYSDIHISPEVQRLSGSVSPADIDFNDERTQYILSK